MLLLAKGCVTEMKDCSAIFSRLICLGMIQRIQHGVYCLDTDLADAAAIHFRDDEAAGAIIDAFSGAGYVAELSEKKAGEGFHTAIAGQLPLHLGFEIAQVDGAVQKEIAVGVCQQRAGGVVKLVFDFSGELFDGVLRCDEADGGTVFIDNDRHVAAAALEVTQEIENGLGFRNDKELAHDLAEAKVEERHGRSGIGDAGGRSKVDEAGEVF